MKRILLVCALMLCAPYATAQQGVKIQVPTGNGNSYQTIGPLSPLPITGSASSALTITTNTQAPVAPNTATATKSDLTGCEYRATAFTATDLQQMATACDQNGRVQVINGTANQVTSTPTIQASAYSAGNCIGGFNSVSVTTYTGQSGFLTNIRLASIAGSAYNVVVYVFDSQPTTSICTDKGTFSLSSADVDKLIGAPTSVTLANPASAFTPTVASIDFTPPRPFRAGGSSSSGVQAIWYGLQLASAITPTTTTDLHTRFGVARD